LLSRLFDRRLTVGLVIVQRQSLEHCSDVPMGERRPHSGCLEEFRWDRISTSRPGQTHAADRSDPQGLKQATRMALCRVGGVYWAGRNDAAPSQQFGDISQECGQVVCRLRSTRYGGHGSLLAGIKGPGMRSQLRPVPPLACQLAR